MDYKMATTKSVNQSILFPIAKHVVIATKIEFLLLFSGRDIVKTAVSRCPFCDPGWRTKTVFRSIGNIGVWFQKGLGFPKMYIFTTLQKI